MGRSRGKDKRSKGDKGDVKDEGVHDKKPSVFERLSTPHDVDIDERPATREDARPRERGRKADYDVGSKRRGETSDKEGGRPRKRPAIVWEPRPRGDEPLSDGQPAGKDDLQGRDWGTPAPSKEANSAGEPATSAAAMEKALAAPGDRGGKLDLEEVHDRKEKDRREQRSERADRGRDKEVQGSRSQEREKEQRGRDEERWDVGGKAGVTTTTSGREGQDRQAHNSRDKGEREREDKEVLGKEKERGKTEKAASAAKERGRQQDGEGGTSLPSRRDPEKEKEGRDRERTKERDRDRERDRERDTKEKDDRVSRDADKEVLAISQVRQVAGDRDRGRERDRDRDRDRRSDRDKVDRDFDGHSCDRVVDMPDITPFSPDVRGLDTGGGGMNMSLPVQGLSMPHIMPTITRPSGVNMAPKDYIQPPPPPPPPRLQQHQDTGFGFGSGLHGGNREPHDRGLMSGDGSGGVVGPSGSLGMSQQLSMEHGGGGGGAGAGFRPPFGPMVSARVTTDGNKGRGGRPFHDEHVSEDTGRLPPHLMPPLPIAPSASFSPDPSTTYLDGGGSTSPRHGRGPPGPGSMRGHMQADGAGSRGPGNLPLVMPPIVDMGSRGGGGGGGTGMSYQQQQQLRGMMGPGSGSGGGGQAMMVDGGMAADGGMGSGGGGGVDGGGGGGGGGAGPRMGHPPPPPMQQQRGGEQATHGFAGSGYAAGGPVTVGGGGGGLVTHPQQQAPSPAKDPKMQMRLRREHCRQRAQLAELMPSALVVGHEAYGEMEKTLKRIGAEVAILPPEAQPSLTTDPRPASLTVGLPAAVSGGAAAASSRLRRFALADLLLDDAYWSSAHLAATLAGAAMTAASGTAMGGASRAGVLGLGSEEHLATHSRVVRAFRVLQEKSSSAPWYRSGKGGPFLLTEAQHNQGLF